jgi:hypothetical protein
MIFRLIDSLITVTTPSRLRVTEHIRDAAAAISAINHRTGTDTRGAAGM